MAYLPDLLASLQNQTCRDFRVLIIDNASTDNITRFLREEYPEVAYLRNARNMGFASAHNQGIRYAMECWGEGEWGDRFVLVTNPDTILEPDCLERLVAAARAYPHTASFTPKLLRAHVSDPHDVAMRAVIKTNELDSTGLVGQRSRVFADRGAGEEDRGQYDDKQDVFGVSGALALYRASALRDAKIGDEYFDNDFFCYKEDVDLAWRLRSLGFEARFVPEARAYHYRGMYGKEKMGLLERIKNRRGKSRVRSYYSTRNHWSMLMKNEHGADALLSFPWIAGHELARFLYVVLFETKNVPAFFEAISRAPRMWRKRRAHRPRRLSMWFL